MKMNIQHKKLMRISKLCYILLACMLLFSSLFPYIGADPVEFIDGDETWYIEALTNGSGNWTVPVGISSIDILVVGGGGGAGIGTTDTQRNGGGGGAGGLVWVQNISVTPGTNKSYSVGAGGIGGWDYEPYRYNGSCGQNTTFDNLTAVGGGGGGGHENRNGLSGGSGGGAGANHMNKGTGGTGIQTSQAGWSGTYGFGNNGGNAYSNEGVGGGGAGGTNVYQAGGVGMNLSSYFGMTFGVYGVFSHGGGAHGTGDEAVNNTGNGGRAKATSDASNGGPGGSGIILIRYKVNAGPRISSTYPVDGTVGVSTGLDQINVTIYDPEGDTFNWSIETNPDIGDASDTVETNGTKTCAVTGLAPGITYTVYVNMSDVYENTRNETFTFTTFGNVTFYCYDESNPSVGLSPFGVEITNSHAYQNVSLTNGASISIDGLPYGDVVAILVSSEGYLSRMYIYNISQGDNYQFYFYLPPDVDEETLMYSSASVSDPDADLTINLSCVPERVILVQGWNESLYGHWYSIPETDYIINGSTIIVNESWLDEYTTMVQAQYYCSGNVLDYILHVVNEANIGLDAVTVNVQRLIGSAYTTIASGLTDGNGDITLQLIPQMAYKIQLSKTEYITSTSVYQPVESVRTKTLILVRTTPEFVNESTVDSTITITATLLMNETIHVTYTDILDDTTTITICVYRNESMTLIDCYTVDDTSSVSYYFTDINTTYEYQVVFVYTHGRFGTITDIRYLSGRPMITDTDEFEDLFDIFGDNPFGWSSCVGFLVLCAGVFSFGRRNSGVALVVTGGVMLFIEFTIGITMIGLPLGVLFIIVGVLLQWKNTSRESGYY